MVEADNILLMKGAFESFNQEDRTYVLSNRVEPRNQSFVPIRDEGFFVL